MGLFPLRELGENGVCKEVADGLGAYGVELVVNGHTNTLLTFAHAEGPAELDLIADALLLDEILELLDDLARAFDVT